MLADDVLRLWAAVRALNIVNDETALNRFPELDALTSDVEMTVDPVTEITLGLAAVADAEFNGVQIASYSAYGVVKFVVGAVLREMRRAISDGDVQFVLDVMPHVLPLDKRRLVDHELLTQVTGRLRSLQSATDRRMTSLVDRCLSHID